MEPVFASLAVATGFTSRAFLPCFVAALFMRFGPEAWLVPEMGMMQTLGMPGAVPPWFTHDISLIVLGLLSTLEIAATKNPDARAVLEELTRYAKPVMALLTVAGIMSVDDNIFVEQIVHPEPEQAGMFGLGFAFLIATGVYYLVSARAALVSKVFDFDTDDATGLQKLLAWLEDAWSVFGIIIALLFPLVMLVLAGIGVLAMLALRRALERREAARRVACETCGASIYSAAPRCPRCHSHRPEPRAINPLGVATQSPARVDHDMQLRSFRRCPSCAERKTGRGPAKDPCTVCGTLLFPDAETRAAYDRWVRVRVAPSLLVTLLLSFVPVVGMIPAVLYSRVTLVSPYARYLPRGRAIVARLLLRVLLLLAIAFQFVPLLGAFGIPISAFVSHTVYRRLFFASAPRG